MKDLVNHTEFYYHLADHPKELRQLAEDMTPFYVRVVEVLAESPAEVVLMGANYDDTITYPPFFEEHILPWMQRWAAMLHAKGKLFLSHCDGENEGLLDLLAESGMDVAESVCGPPMVAVSMARMREIDQVGVIVVVEFLYFITFFTARVSQRVTLGAMTSLEAAAKSVAQRDALLAEARAELLARLRAQLRRARLLPLLEQVPESQVGSHAGYDVEGERVLTHLFRAAVPGYRGWRWSVTVTRASRQRQEPPSMAAAPKDSSRV